jgi:hypothetical protein
MGHGFQFALALTFMKPEGIPTQRFRQLGFCCSILFLTAQLISLNKRCCNRGRAGKVIFQTAPEGPL